MIDSYERNDEMFRDGDYITDNVIEETGISFTETDWLEVPASLLKPKKICAVNQFVHVVEKLCEQHQPTSCELVLVGRGSTIPDHFRMMIYCMHQVIP